MERRLDDAERDRLLNEPLPAIFATERKQGGVHAVPVWYLYRGGEFRVLTGCDAVKVKNAVRTGRATICVQRSVGDDLSYVTAEGSVRVEACTSGERRDLWVHYRNEAEADVKATGDLSAICVLVLTPTRWTAIVE